MNIGESTYAAAVRLAKINCHVFPLATNTKDQPIFAGYSAKATTDIEKIRSWWFDSRTKLYRPYNVAISTTSFNGSKYLIGVDEDCKDGKDGAGDILKLELQGFMLPATYTQFTPTKGKHYIYWSDVPVGQRKLAPGVDIRSFHGYLVGSGSFINGIQYTSDDTPISKAPQWLVEICGSPSQKSIQEPPEDINAELARIRAAKYLRDVAPIAIQGANGDDITFRVSAAVKDFGVTCLEAHGLMIEHWNERCLPPWPIDELMAKIENAYSYGKERIGSLAPEACFDVIKTDTAKAVVTKEIPEWDRLNSEFAFVVVDSSHHILWENTDQLGRPKLNHLAEKTFHAMLAPKKVTIIDAKGKARAHQISHLWKESPNRRAYRGFCFMPEQPTPKGYYNLWKGWAVTPLEKGASPSREAQSALETYLEHIRDNICNKNPILYEWLISYLAHMIQKPWDKPGSCVVLRGREGVGKNEFLGRIKDLLGKSYLETSRKRYLEGTFNSHMEKLLMFTLAEAFWSGSKQTDGILKDLITNESHTIEHKFSEPFDVDNLARIVINTNEDWAVPAGPDARRYAVFDVGEYRMKDTGYFVPLKAAMRKRGGNEYLLRYLMDKDLSNFDAHLVPMTNALLLQKKLGLSPMHDWWLDSLKSGRISASDFGGEWETIVEKRRARQAFGKYCEERRSKSLIPNETAFGMALGKCVKFVTTRFKTEAGHKELAYKFPSLGDCREQWEKFIGHKENWEEGETTNEKE